MPPETFPRRHAAFADGNNSSKPLRINVKQKCFIILLKVANEMSIDRRSGGKNMSDEGHEQRHRGLLTCNEELASVGRSQCVRLSDNMLSLNTFRRQLEVFLQRLSFDYH